MKILKSLLILLCAMLLSAGAQAASITGALTGKNAPKITYKSVDAFNNEIELSARLYYKGSSINYVLLNNHPTITHNDGCPTGDNPQMEAIQYMISEGALVVCPDYLGFGITAGSTHPYMCTTLTARNILDCYKAAIKYVKEKGVSISDSYYTLNVGYSQGGTNALAFQRYLETEATQADRDLVNLAGSLCGAGVYDQQIVFDEYEKMAQLDYPILMLYVLQGQKEAFGNTIMRNLELSECFTPQFWADCTKSGGYLDLLKNKEKNVDEINDVLKKAGYTTFYSMMNAAYKDRSSKLYRTIKKVLAQSNLLAEGWTPAAPIIFYHDKAGNDIVVPYAETTAAMKRFEGHCSYVDAIDDYTYDTASKSNKYLWHAAVFREIWVSAWSYPGQNTIMGLAAMSGNEKYSFSSLDHRTFGARFYTQLLAERPKMRPATPSTKGTAASIDPAGVEVKEIGTDGKATAGNYDRISIALPNDVTAGEPIYVNFPATVDGYTFGCNAERYHLTVVDGVATEINPMDDFDNFEAGETYLVVPEVAVESPVYSYTAGVRTHCLGVDAPCVIDKAIVLNYSIGDLARLVDKLNAGSYIYKLEHVGKIKNGILETENK